MSIAVEVVTTPGPLLIALLAVSTIVCAVAYIAPGFWTPEAFTALTYEPDDDSDIDPDDVLNWNADDEQRR